MAAAALKRYYNKKKAEALANGLCIYCFKRRQEPELKGCLRCRSMRNLAWHKNRKRWNINKVGKIEIYFYQEEK